MPWPAFISVALTTAGLTGNTQMAVYKFVLPRAITVNKISLNVSSVGTAGTFKIGVFSEDGQTNKIEVTTASISAGGVVTTAVAAVQLPAGVYYFFALPQSTANVTFDAWTEAFSALRNIAAEDEFSGIVTATANTVPATFDPTALTNALNAPIFRLDN